MATDNPTHPEEHADPVDQQAAKDHAVVLAINAFEAKYDAANNCQSEHNAEVFLWTKRATRGVWVYTGLTIVIAVAAAVQICISRDTEHRQLRAYILKSDTSIVVDFPNTLDLRFITKNFGLTPAYKVIGWSCIIVGYFSKEAGGAMRLETKFPGPAFDEKSGQPTIIGPQDTRTILFPTFCDGPAPGVRPITPDEVARIKAGHAAVYVYGEQRYFDAFGDRHFTKYRIVGLGDGATFDAPEGNDAD